MIYLKETFRNGDIIVEIGNATKWVVWGTSGDYYRCWTMSRGNKFFGNFPKVKAADRFVKVGSTKDGREAWARR